MDGRTRAQEIHRAVVFSPIKEITTRHLEKHLSSTEEAERIATEIAFDASAVASRLHMQTIPAYEEVGSGPDLARETGRRAEVMIGSLIEAARAELGGRIPSAKEWHRRFSEGASMALALDGLLPRAQLLDFELAHLLASPPLAVDADTPSDVQLLYWSYLNQVFSSLAQSDIPWLEVQDPADRRPDEAEAARYFQTHSSSDFWVALIMRDPKSPPRKGYPPEAIFRLFFNWLGELVRDFRVISELQWQTADLLGALSGIDRVGLCWYPLAQRYRWKRQQGIRALYNSARHRSEQAPALNTEAANILALPFDWSETLSEVPEAIVFAVRALDHIIDQVPLLIPAISQVVLMARRGVHADPTVVGVRIALSHPLVSQRAAQTTTSLALSGLRKAKRRGLSNKDNEILREVRLAGLEQGYRAHPGFWQSFQGKWNRAHPESPMGVNHLRVRYHRLSRRLAEKE